MKKLVITLRETILILFVLFSSGMSWDNTTAIKNNNIASREMYPSLAPILEKVMPSVININVEGTTIVHTAYESNYLEPFLDNNHLLFCQGDSLFRKSPFCHSYLHSNHIRQEFRALGSGVIINAEKGYAVTNHHVIENANKIQVQLSDGRRYDARLIGADINSDIALIQLQNAKNLTAIKMADSDTVRVGDYSIAIGNPYGLGETVTSGIISALGRTGLDIENYENFIQTDAAINRGNSGGALVNIHGELIGVNTAILATDGGNIGIGFAIPGNMVKSLIAQIIQFGEVRRGSLGVIGMELNSDLAQIMKINAQKGAFVNQVLPNTSASEAGIQAGDIIISLNKKRISSFAVLRTEISSLPVNTTIQLGIFREGNIKNIIVKLKRANKINAKAEKVYRGIEGIELNNNILNGKKVIKVTNVKLNTSASRLGFKKDDIIIGINQKLVSSTDELQMILDTKPKILVFIINRGNNTIYLVSK